MEEKRIFEEIQWEENLSRSEREEMVVICVIVAVVELKKIIVVEEHNPNVY